VTAFREQKIEKLFLSALLFHAFGEMQPGCIGENLQSGSSSFYPCKKKKTIALNFHAFPVMSWATLSKALKI
jgi:hypothetical protein